MKLTDEEKRYIQEHYLTQKASEIAAFLGRTPEGIRCYAKRAGLAKRMVAPRVRKCDTCQIFCNGHCLYAAEDDANICRYNRYTVAAWPEEKTKMQLLFENI